MAADRRPRSGHRGQLRKFGVDQHGKARSHPPQSGPRSSGASQSLPLGLPHVLSEVNRQVPSEGHPLQSRRPPECPGPPGRAAPREAKFSAFPTARRGQRGPSRPGPGTRRAGDTSMSGASLLSTGAMATTMGWSLQRQPLWVPQAPNRHRSEARHSTGGDPVESEGQRAGRGCRPRPGGGASGCSRRPGATLVPEQSLCFLRRLEKVLPTQCPLPSVA